MCKKGDLKLLILLPPLLSAGIRCVLLGQLAILFLTAMVLVPGNFLCSGCASGNSDSRGSLIQGQERDVSAQS